MIRYYSHRVYFYSQTTKYYQLDTENVSSGAVPAATGPFHPSHQHIDNAEEVEFQDSEVVENDTVSLFDREKNAIVRALERHRGRRRPAAQDLGISERTLYRKIREYGIEV